MNNRLKAELEKTLYDFMDKHCEDNDWPDGFVYEGLEIDMALAASLVFDSCKKSSIFTQDECA